MQKQKILKFQTKNVMLGIFRLKIGKNDCDIWNHSPRFCRNAKNGAKLKKKAKLGPKMFYLGVLGCKFEKILSYFQHPRICQTAKFRAKLKVFNFGTKIPDLGVFRLQF